ncbi:MAG: 8-oxo-dGTP pyrophosphatase MutT (NUDIX family) [Hyphomicrobiaceae bacterium]
MSKGLEAAASKYGQPLEILCTLESLAFPPVSERTHGEVCMAIRRKNGCFLLQSKESYPNQVMRLPSGGIHKDEDLEAALLREIWEETNLDVEVRAFVARISYGNSGRVADFRTNLFVSDEIGGTFQNNDPSEHISRWIEVAPADLLHYAACLQDIVKSWRHWGRFRAFSLETLSNHCTEQKH